MLQVHHNITPTPTCKPFLRSRHGSFGRSCVSISGAAGGFDLYQNYHLV